MQFIISNRWVKGSFANLVFQGPCGSGKTSLCSAITSNLAKDGFTVLYYRWSDFTDEVLIREDVAKKIYLFKRKLDKPNVLIFDDIGISECSVPPLVRDVFFSVVDSRFTLKKPVILSSQLRVEAYKTLFGEMIPQSNEDPKSMFKNYWYDLGGIPSILIKNVAKLLNSDVINSFNQDIEFKVFKNSFANPTSIETMDEKVMLFQTGYLTLAKPIETNIISLKIPNQELRASFEQLQFLIWFENNQKVIESKLKDNIFNLNYDSDIKQIIEYFTLILNALPYGKDVYKNEYNVITPIFTFLLGSGFKVFTETHTLKGRTNLRIDFDNNRSMIFEFKFNSIKSKQTADDKLQETIKQITDKAYAKLPNKEVKSYAIVFDEKQKSFVAYKEA